jgi:ribosome biogenesis GTPase
VEAYWVQGRITKGVGGHYSVMTAAGEFNCRARGLFRKHEITPLVGDLAEISIVDEAQKTGFIKNILPRKNELNRPKVANIDQVVVVCSIRPVVNFPVLDAFLITCEVQEVDAILCVNKIDLDTENNHKEIIGIYEMAQYWVVATSAETGAGMDALRERLMGKTSIFAGASGVGKSRILNTLYPDLNLAIGDLSEKIGRGRHTTRHTSLIRVAPETYVVDSPGFTSLTIDHIPRRDLQDYYPEFLDFQFECFFTGCLHITEHDCAVKEQVGITIHPQRYEQYKAFMEGRL